MMMHWFFILFLYALYALLGLAAFLLLFMAGYLLRYWHENDFKNFFQK